MSRRDLEIYWERREEHAKQLTKDITEEPKQPKVLVDFVKFRESVEKDLQDKDPRALRAVKYANQFSMNEGNHIAKELYPDLETRPGLAAVRIGMNGEKALCFRIYDALAEMALDAASRLAPL